MTCLEICSSKANSSCSSANSLRRYYFRQENGINSPPFRQDGGRFPSWFAEGIILTGASGSFVSFTSNCVAVALGWPLVEPWGQPFDTSALLFVLHSVLLWMSFELPKYTALLCGFPGTVSFMGTDKDCGFARAHGSILTVVLCVTLPDSCFRQGWVVFFFLNPLREVRRVISG